MSQRKRNNSRQIILTGPLIGLMAWNHSQRFKLNRSQLSRSHDWFIGSTTTTTQLKITSAYLLYWTLHANGLRGNFRSFDTYHSWLFNKITYQTNLIQHGGFLSSHYRTAPVDPRRLHYRGSHDYLCAHKGSRRMSRPLIQDLSVSVLFPQYKGNLT